MTDTMQKADAEKQIGSVLDDVATTRKRILVEDDGRPVAAIVTVDDLKQLNRLDAEREADFAVLDAISRPFANVDPDEIEREVAKAIAEVRAERRAENL